MKNEEISSREVLSIIDRKYKSMVDRCTNPKAANFRRYGARGIKVKITKDELIRLWVRDHAHNLKKPAIDRIDNDGHYEFSNCRFIESVDNLRRMNTEKTHCPKGHKFTKKNTRKHPLGRECRECHKLYDEQYRQKHPEVQDAYDRKHFRGAYKHIRSNSKPRGRYKKRETL